MPENKNLGLIAKDQPQSTILPITFLMVGAQRCGTTWADEALREHPQVYLPAVRKTAFFDEHFDRGIERYYDLFKDVSAATHKAIGEVGSGYCLEHAMPRVAACCPDAKIIMAMRDPIEHSYYYLSRRTLSGHAWRSFEEAIEANTQILVRGRYIEQVECILSHYQPDRVLLLFYDDLVADERSYLKSILSFIGVNELVKIKQVGQRRHSGRVAEIRHRFEKFGLGPVFRTMKHSKAGNFLRRLAHRSVGRSSYRSQIRKVTRQHLLDYYKPLNNKLAALTNRDLSGWNR